LRQQQREAGLTAHATPTAPNRKSRFESPEQARFSKELAELFSAFGVQAVIGFIRNTLTSPWLDPQQIEQRRNRPFRLRLV
jgi:hypothetical protein